MGTGGLCPARLGRLHEVMARHVEDGQVPGLVALVARRGEVHATAIGTPRDTIFRIASMTKPVTAVAAMILVEECRLRLDEPVDRLLPELADRRVLRRVEGPLDDTVPAQRPITVRDLLTFRMGLGLLVDVPATAPIQVAMAERHLAPGPPAPAAVPGPDRWLGGLGELPLVHQPGDRWLYHTSAEVLGVVVARAADTALERLLRERIFEPLGMVDTGFSVPPDRIDRLATAWSTDPETGQRTVYDEGRRGQWSRPPAFPSGGGGLVSTADDYLAFGQMLLDGGRYAGGRLLSRTSVEAMTTDQLRPLQKAGAGLVPGWFDSHGWGFGLSVVTRRDHPAHPVGTFGWDGGLGTSWRSDPSEGMVSILMTQQAWAAPCPPLVCVDFWTAAYQAVAD
jgi:CubicO group peptidase (beta-lactamase class C family)